MPEVLCKVCKNSFYAKPVHVRNGHGKYCSRKCQYEGAKNGKNIACDTCKKEVYRSKKDISRTKSGKHFCSKSCQAVWRNTYFSGEKHKNWKNGDSTYRKILLKTNVPQKCRGCYTEDKRVLAVHHIDKNHRNNKIKNLAWLCHNCHYLVHHDKVWGKKIMEALV